MNGLPLENVEIFKVLISHIITHQNRIKGHYSNLFYVFMIVIYIRVNKVLFSEKFF